MGIFRIMLADLRKLYDMESRIANMLTCLAGKSDDYFLREALEDHRIETIAHRNRLEALACNVGWLVTGETSLVSQALVGETREVVNGMERGHVRDTLIIGAAKKAQHLQMSLSIARAMENEEAIEVFERILDEEERTDCHLRQLSAQDIYRTAVML
jgi:ferritin-like metal-binding protein YciE